MGDVVAADQKQACVGRPQGAIIATVAFISA